MPRKDSRNGNRWQPCLRTRPRRPAAYDQQKTGWTDDDLSGSTTFSAGLLVEERRCCLPLAGLPILQKYTINKNRAESDAAVLFFRALRPFQKHSAYVMFVVFIRDVTHNQCAAEVARVIALSHFCMPDIHSTYNLSCLSPDILSR